MKILQIIPYFYPALSVGGTSSIVFDTSKILVRKGHDVTVYTTDLLDGDNRVNYPRNQQVDIEGIKVFYFSNISNYLAFSQHVFFSPFFFSTLAKTIRNFDVIHLHEVYTLLHVWTYFIATKTGIPYVISSHGTAGLLKQAGRVGRKKIFNYLIGEKIFKNAAKVIAVAKEEKKHYYQLAVPTSKVKVIYNGVDIDNYSVVPDSSTSRRKLKIDQSKFTLLYLSRIHKKKGIDMLLQAFYILKKKKTDVILLIAGPIEDREYMDKLTALVKELNLEKSAIFTGELLGDDKLAAFSAADIFVLPSYGEGLPVSVLEAGAVGLPLVITDKCNIPEVSIYKAGIVTPAHPKAIYEALLKMLEDKAYRKHAGLNAKKMVEEYFSIDQSAEKLEKVYKKAIIDG